MNVYLNGCGTVCSLGHSLPFIRERLFNAAKPSGLQASPIFGKVGAVVSPLPPLAELPLRWRSRNNQLLLCALEQLREPLEQLPEPLQPRKFAVVIGTSTSGIQQGEVAVASYGQTGQWPVTYRYSQQEMGNAATFVAHAVGARGPAYVVSTACSSSAKALAAAARLLRTGEVDAVVAGGADTLCGLTQAGFTSLGQVASERCNPLSIHRCGINLGEGAALFLLSRTPSSVRLAGWGETSDAHHIASPDPCGRAPTAALEQALKRANIVASQVDYVNLHGTATIQNDAMESQVVHRTFGAKVRMSSTKPLTGHTLGACGAIEAAFCYLTLTDNPKGQLPPHWWDGLADPALPTLSLATPGFALGRAPLYALSQSFAFGGSNAVLVMAAES